MFLEEKKIINADSKTVYEVISDYINWPNYLSVNRSVEHLYRDGEYEVYAVKHLVGKKLHASQCRRREYPPERIEFILDNKFFKFLKGAWVINPVSEEKTELISIHEGEARIGIGKKLIEKIIGRLFFDKTTPVTMEELKIQCERKAGENHGF